jgi:hypothetical protein
MNLITTLTTERKNMNMQKLGTVSAGAIRPANFTKPNNGGLYRMTRYTLCAFRRWAQGRT